jgi:hypothetical protein
MTLPIRSLMFGTIITSVAAASCDGLSSRTCEYRAMHSLETLPRFSFTVSLPDGSSQSCASLSPVSTSPLGGEISGEVTDVSGTAFSLDTCPAGTGCSAAVYRFAIDTPELPLALPLNRQITVTWQLVFAMGCAQGLVVHDGSPADVAAGVSPGIWLAGADSNLEPPSNVPFSVARQELYCNPNPGVAHPCGAGSPPPDDYVLVFTPSSGEPSLSLDMGSTGTLALTTAPGFLQHLTIHNLRSFQTDRCDDYWNWGWWAAGNAGSNGQLE